MATRLRPVLLLLVVATVLVVGSLLLWGGNDAQQQGVPAGATASPDPSATASTASPGSSATASTASPGRSATASTAVPTGGAATTAGYDLAADEARGGHTLARHIGKSDADLRARLRDEPDISAASAYRDRATAERAVGAALREGATKVTRWEQAASHPNLVLRARMPEPVGRSLKRGASNAKDVRSVVVVLRWAGSDWYVLTSYPEEP